VRVEENNFDQIEIEEKVDQNEDIIDIIPQETEEFTLNFDEDNTEEFGEVEKFDDLEKSISMPEVPQGTALFNAIMNKQTVVENKEEAVEEKDLDSFMLDDKDIFTPKTTINTIEEEPVLFPEQDSMLFDGKEPVKEEIIIEPETKKLSLIDRVLGFKNRKETYTVTEQVSPKLIEEVDEITFSTDDDIDNLDIPAFLRKK
jgi:hypothetical protein